MKNRILIVDDDALVCRATARLVEHVTGSAVECCGSGGEALRVFKDAPGAFVCVVTDYEMPGMDGLELGGHLRAIAPEVRMLLVTGSPGALGGTDVYQRGFDCVLAKPFDLATIGEALHRVLPLPHNPPALRPHDGYGGCTSFFESPHGILRAAI